MQDFSSLPCSECITVTKILFTAGISFAICVSCCVEGGGVCSAGLSLTNPAARLTFSQHNTLAPNHHNQSLQCSVRLHSQLSVCLG